jgi:hypothetical protein
MWNSLWKIRVTRKKTQMTRKPHSVFIKHGAWRPKLPSIPEDEVVAFNLFPIMEEDTEDDDTETGDDE